MTFPQAPAATSERGGESVPAGAGVVPPPAGTTIRQQQILDFIVAFTAREGYPPTVREIGHGVGLTSVSSVQAQLDQLERGGRIERRPHSPRALRVVEASVQ
jgi:repressor LexA